MSQFKPDLECGEYHIQGKTIFWKVSLLSLASSFLEKGHLWYEAAGHSFGAMGGGREGSILFLDLPPTGFGFPAKENDSMDAKTTHPRGKHIKAKTIAPAETQVMVVSAAGENNALMPRLFQASLVLTRDASQFYTHGLLIPSLASREEHFDLSSVQADCRCTNKNASVLVSVNFLSHRMNIDFA